MYDTYNEFYFSFVKKKKSKKYKKKQKIHNCKKKVEDKMR